MMSAKYVFYYFYRFLGVQYGWDVVYAETTTIWQVFRSEYI